MLIVGLTNPRLSEKASMNIYERFHGRYFGSHGIITVIDICLKRDYTGSALAMICAVAESLTFLGLPEERNEVYEEDFIAWTNRYMQPDKIGICGSEIWRVRCALVDKFTTHRELTRGSKPREVLFAWGRYSIYEGARLPSGSRWHRIMGIHAEELYKGLIKGTETFCERHVIKPENEYIVDQRMNQIFASARPRIHDGRW